MFPVLSRIAASSPQGTHWMCMVQGTSLAGRGTAPLREAGAPTRLMAEALPLAVGVQLNPLTVRHRYGSSCSA